jgi:hypothetical protein
MAETIESVTVESEAAIVEPTSTQMGRFALPACHSDSIT